MKLEVTITKTIRVPHNATHYSGELTDRPGFWFSPIEGEWWFYHADGNGWRFNCKQKPSWLKEIQNTPTVKIIP